MFYSRDFNVRMPWFKLRFLAFSEYIYLLGSFSICYLILTLQSEFTATAGHCQELRSQILKVSPPTPSSPAPMLDCLCQNGQPSVFPMAELFFFFFFSEIYKSIFRKCYVCL